MKFDKAIHAECEVIQHAVAGAVSAGHTLMEELEELPSGLKPKTMDSYMLEWGRYRRSQNDCGRQM